MEGLCLSLGHNSSAVYIRNGQILGGYETERITGVKSDSSFPRGPIELLKKQFRLTDDIPLFVGHWALDGQLSTMKEKHWDVKYIKENFRNSPVHTLSKEYTHHDSHAYSALAFSGWENDAHCLVMDGFGTMGEHMSVYKIINRVPVLQWRKYGLGSSLGLLYQYTTGFLGMKQNQDEYKLLAYEAHIDEVHTYVKHEAIRKKITFWTDYYLGIIESPNIDPETDPVCNLGALPEIATRIANMHKSILRDLEAESIPGGFQKILIAYITQAIVENVVASVVRSFGPTNLLVSGGLFYNVKLNNLLSRMVPGALCVMPLCGDQGAALGIYHSTHSIEWPDHLFWGHRETEYPESHVPNLYRFDMAHEEAAMNFAAGMIESTGMVNIVRGSMEFGPRALCNTSTLARPTRMMADRINALNDRTNEMPFAPVMDAGMADHVFENVGGIYKSLGYMIITRDFKHDFGRAYDGASHFDYDRKVFTGRPQISSDSLITDITDQYGMLINTSFNFHGVPIVYNLKDILYTHTRQQEIAAAKRLPPPATVFIN